MMLDGTLFIGRLLTIDGDHLTVGGEHVPLQLILDDTSEEVVAADCDTLCEQCSYTAVAGLGARRARARINADPDLIPVVHLTDTAGVRHVGFYVLGRTDLASAPCDRCGAETVLATDD